MLKSALLGNPVRQSFSPKIYTTIAKSFNMENYRHELIHCSDLKDFYQKLDMLHKNGYMGVNITMPYKTLLFSEMDDLDESAIKANSINTVKFHGDRKIGYNTDFLGFKRAFETQLGKISSHDRVVIFGNGGVARAIVHELSHYVSEVDIVIRENSKNRLDYFDKQIKINYYKNNFRNILYLLNKDNIFINATSVGMYPNNENTLFDTTFNLIQLDLDCCCKAFDVIFNPTTTSFLNFFKKRNCQIGYGYQMLYFQAQKSFEIWTGKKVKDKIGLVNIKNSMEEWISQIQNGM